MPAAERLRWLELLSYIHALVYHERNPSERPGLQETIAVSVATEQHRQEVSTMRRTIADELMEEGALKALRRSLLRILRKRFGELPPAMVDTIETTTDIEQLEEWGERFMTAKTLKDMGIRPAK